jgi:hypothetical protein
MNMTGFKIGDFVKPLAENVDPTEGMTGKVVAIHKEGDLVVEFEGWEGGHRAGTGEGEYSRWFFPPEWLRLVSPTTTPSEESILAGLQEYADTLISEEDMADYEPGDIVLLPLTHFFPVGIVVDGVGVDGEYKVAYLSRTGEYTWRYMGADELMPYDA